MKNHKIVAKNIATGTKYIRCEKVRGNKYKVSSKEGGWGSTWLVDTQDVRFI